MRRIRLRLSPRQIVVYFRGTTFLSFSQTTAVRFLRSDRFLPSLLLSFSERWRKKSQRRKILLCSTFPVILFFSQKWRIGKENINRRGTYHDKGEEEDEAITRDASRRRREKRAHTLPQKSGSLIRDGGPTPPAPRRFFFPPFPSLLFYSHVIAKNRASLSLSFLLFLLSFYFPPTIDDHHRAVQESDRVQHLSRLLAPASDYDDPSTTTVSSFSFDLWITDNRIRRTCSSYSPYDQSRPNHPLHTTHQRKPPCFSFFLFLRGCPNRSPNFLFFPFFYLFIFFPRPEIRRTIGRIFDLGSILSRCIARRKL